MKYVKHIIELYIISFVVGVFFACSGGEGGEQPPKEELNPPEKAIGVLPANGEPCSDYEEIAENDTQVLISFSWNSARFAQSYEVIILEGSNEIVRKSVGGLHTEIELDRGKTYTWQIVSINDDGSSTSNTYSFTSPGIPQRNFAPYAATITVEFDTINSEMLISWVGSDEDGDALSYEALIYQSNELIYEFNDLSDTFLPPISYIPSREYSIEVTSKDSFGNFSISEVTVSTFSGF
ncbi:hypothetical protein [Flagellimonas marina]|uniref:Fibronectin type-III domain-containing protein n=1 Tax=Flagellimonas marina TaxID=1775168 RepID=A0ABV8PQZ5_9FLAO